MRRALVVVCLAACGGRIDPSTVSSAQVAAPGDDTSSSGGGAPSCATVIGTETLGSAMGALAVDDTDVYVIEEDTSRIYRYSKCDVADTAEVYDGQFLQPAGGSMNLAVDRDFIYWTTQAYGGSIVRMPKTGGQPQVVVEHVYQAMDFVLDDDDVYWVDRGYPSGSGVIGGNVSVVAKAGGTPRVLAKGEPAPQAIALYGDTVYWANSKFADAVGAIKSIPKAGGEQTTLATDVGFVGSLAVSTDTIAWIAFAWDTNAPTQVRTIPTGGGEPIAIAEDPGIGETIVSDGAAFYWGTTAAGSVSIVELSPDGITTSVIGQDVVPGGAVADGAHGIAINQTRVWSIADAWIDNPSGAPQTILSSTDR